jgi:UDP-N-acetylmuramate--alanine ligase
MSALYTPPPGSIPTLAVPSLEGVRHLHLIGAGGAGMRNLAALLLARGVEVSGSDLKDSKALRRLEELGATVFVGHDAAQVGQPAAVVISSAISERNVELVEARRRGIEVWARAQVLAAISQGHRSVAVAGTHGKTTTTSMVAVVLERAGLDPTYLVGGDLNESGSGARSGVGDIFVFEADESDGSFLLTTPAIGVVTNVEVDHVDFYPRGRDEIEAAFASFVSRCERVVACGDDDGAVRSLERSGTRAMTYGTNGGSDLRLAVESVGAGGARGTLSSSGLREDLELGLPVDGVHNLLDAAAAVAVAMILGVDPRAATESLSTFGGVHRRFELRGSARGAEFYDDYGHVPTELAVTLDVARRVGASRVVAVFQPHRYSRTQAMWRELGASLTGADLIVITDVYGADQDPIPGVSGRLVADGVTLADPTKTVEYLPHGQQVIDFLEREVHEGDLVITMGCGDVWMLGDATLARLREGRS